jgi:AP-4 complex subunit beta-1
MSSRPSFAGTLISCFLLVKVSSIQHIYLTKFDFSCHSYLFSYNDPSCVKSLKVDILVQVATEANQASIMAELTEYVSDVDPDLARQAIRAIAKVGIHLPSAVDAAIGALLGLLELRTNYVTSHVCMMLKDILRKYPDRYEEVVPAVEKCLRDVDEPEGKAAVVWIIGEYGDLIATAPYLLEPLIDTYADEASATVRLELLTAAMKLFFKRPPEMQKMLGRLLQVAVGDVTNIDVRDRALLYYRLLQLDVHEVSNDSIHFNCPCSFWRFLFDVSFFCINF